MDGHITLKGNYHKDVLDAFVEQAQKTKLSQLVILEPSSMFLSALPYIKRVRATYPCQQEWYQARILSSVWTITCVHRCDAQGIVSNPCEIWYLCRLFYTA